ncbi:MAG: hypothetical protein MUC81_03355 [Bacteroidia bacterium]|nr:hypothetical protein [Bacteroidia bacterium]
MDSLYSINDHELLQRLTNYFKDDGFIACNNLQQAHELLSSLLVFYLINDMQFLLRVLYQIDVSETKVRAVFNCGNPKDIAPGLSQLIISRELEKSISRRKYK